MESEILQSEGFLKFIESSSKIIERTLGQINSNVDILKDYKTDSKGDIKGLESLVLCTGTVFEDESVRTRPVMDLQCSPHFSELFLAAYGAKSGPKGGKKIMGSEGETPGMVAVWSHLVRACVVLYAYKTYQSATTYVIF